VTKIQSGGSIENAVAGYELPSTGGPGTYLFTFLGTILIAGAGLLLWRRRRIT
jgi:LPXTG-motif cell wall-anchored protein